MKDESEVMVRVTVRISLLLALGGQPSIRVWGAVHLWETVFYLSCSLSLMIPSELPLRAPAPQASKVQAGSPAAPTSPMGLPNIHA